MNAKGRNFASYADVSRHAKVLATACALFLLTGGLSVQAGWLTQTQALLLTIPRTGSATFNTATLFLLCGTWLLLKLFRARGSIRIRLILACAVIGLPALALFEQLSGANLGLSMFALHDWLETDDATLGRMAPNTCAGFLTAGLICLLYDSRDDHYRNATLLTLLRCLLLLVAGISLLGYVLNLEWLYRWFVFNRMGFNTAIALVVLAVGLFIATQPVLRPDEARKINIMVSLLLGIVALVSGLTGFAIYKSGMQQSIANTLNAVADSRSEFLLSSIRQGQQAALAIANAAELHTFLKQRQHKSSGSMTPEHGLRDDAIVFGLAFIQIRDARGISVSRVGAGNESQQLELPIRANEIQTSLVMADRLLLRNIIPIKHEGRLLGTVLTEQALPDVEKVFRYTETMGKSGEIKLCGKRGDMLECLPSRLVPKVHRVPFYKDGKPSFPVAHAILGESGHLDVIDFRGLRVFAAFRPVGDTGLGLVAKMDGDEIYAPLHKGSIWLLAIPLLLLLAAFYLIRRYLGPIARRLQNSEQAARGYAEDVTMSMLQLENARLEVELRERLLLSLTDALPAMIAFIDREERYRHCNDAYVRVLGLPMDQIIGHTVREVLGESNYEHVKPHLEKAFGGETSAFERPMQARGEMRYVESCYIPRTDLEGNILGLYATTWDVTRIRQRELHLADKASKDALTGLFNRPAITGILDAEIEDHYTRRGGLAVFFLDVDKFKQVNDTLGHAAGDQVLITFAKRLKDTVRNTDFVARLGGDEFVIVLTSVDSADIAERVAQKVIDAIVQAMEIDGASCNISTSIGIAFIKNQNVPASELLARADAALYEAKNSGRNTYRIDDLSQNKSAT